ncbi:hypothetical protein FPV67DRAFT_1510851, partial [Lyophyllum atratum]
WTYAHRNDPRSQTLSRRASPDCNDEVPTYGLASGKTENDCANIAHATGFRAESASAACSIPAKGSQKKGICYLGGAGPLRRSPEEVTVEPAAPEGGAGGEDGEGKKEKKPCEGNEKPVGSSETPDKQPDTDPSTSPETVLKSPVKAPADVDPTPSQPPTPSETPVVPTKTPSATAANTNGTPGLHSGKGNGKKDDSIAWIGKSLFKMFGGLF